MHKLLVANKNKFAGKHHKAVQDVYPYAQEFFVLGAFANLYRSGGGGSDIFFRFFFFCHRCRCRCSRRCRSRRCRRGCRSRLLWRNILSKLRELFEHICNRAFFRFCGWSGSRSRWCSSRWSRSCRCSRR
ncbi:hypothetical protein R83H12_02696 [Fibrobacteria bacterium R8-3-H12]